MHGLFDHKNYSSDSKFVLKFIKDIEEHYAPSELVGLLDRNVIGQSDAKKKLASTLVNHKHIVEHNLSAGPDDIQLKKANLTLVGPSGTGKTFLVENIAKILDAKVLFVDITKYSQTGYVGGDINDIIMNLFNLCNQDVALTERSIIFLDEIDKIGTAITEGSVSSTGIQRELLKMVDGGKQVIDMSTSTTRKEQYQIDFSHILWIFGGAFTTQRKRKKETIENSSSPGFIPAKEQDLSEAEEFTHEDLIKAGMLPEFAGRMGNIALLDGLGKDDYYDILTKPKDSVVNQAKLLGKLRGIDISFTEKELRDIVNKAFTLKLGARGLKSFSDKLLFEKMYN